MTRKFRVIDQLGLWISTSSSLDRLRWSVLCNRLASINLFTSHRWLWFFLPGMLGKFSLPVVRCMFLGKNTGKYLGWDCPTSELPWSLPNTTEWVGEEILQLGQIAYSLATLELRLKMPERWVSQWSCPVRELWVSELSSSCFSLHSLSYPRTYYVNHAGLTHCASQVPGLQNGMNSNAVRVIMPISELPMVHIHIQAIF